MECDWNRLVDVRGGEECVDVRLVDDVVEDGDPEDPVGVGDVEEA